MELIVFQTPDFGGTVPRSGTVQVLGQSETATVWNLKSCTLKWAPTVFNVFHEFYVEAFGEFFCGMAYGGNALIISTDPFFWGDLNGGYAERAHRLIIVVASRKIKWVESKGKKGILRFQIFLGRVGRLGRLGLVGGFSWALGIWGLGWARLNCGGAAQLLWGWCE